MTKTEICLKLHEMVDALSDMPEWMWSDAYPTIRIGYRDNDDKFIMVVGVEHGNDDE